ncbi:IS630 family transposase [Bacillus sp. 2205SS5-2]|uniref:IS630 family transposase n=1 Tax=Bacillus sp. 2205SS5-2 TaxID=3109031 RepID=UPI003003B4D6
MFKRYQAILMHLKGRSYVEIAEFSVCAVQTVYNYVRAYKTKELEGLVPGQSPGRPCQLTEEQEQKLYKVIAEKVPANVGFPSEMNWTSFLIRDWIKSTFHVDSTDRGFGKVLHRLGLSYSRPTNTLAIADPEKQELFKGEFKWVKKMMNNEIDRILFEDESMIRDYQVLSCTWFPKGKQKIMPTYGKHHGVKRIGTLDYEIGELFLMEEERYDVSFY